MKVEVRAKEFDNAVNGLKGTASVSFDGCFAVHNINIVESRDGNLFVSMPSYKTRQVDENGRDIYKDICFPVTKDFRERLYDAVLTSFKEHKPVMIDTNDRRRERKMSDAVIAAKEDMGEYPFNNGESSVGGSPESKKSIADRISDKVAAVKSSYSGSHETRRADAATR